MSIWEANCQLNALQLPKSRKYFLHRAVDGAKIQMQNFAARLHKYLILHMTVAAPTLHPPFEIAQNYRIAVCMCAMKIDLSRTQHLRSRIQHKFSFTAFSEAEAAALFFLVYLRRWKIVLYAA